MLSSRRFIAVVTGLALVVGSFVAAAPAQAVGTASLSGKLKSPIDATPFVEVFQLQDDAYISIGAVPVNADTTWLYDELDAGSYRVSFIDNKPEDALYATQFYTATGNVVTDDADDERIQTLTIVDGQVVPDLNGELTTISLTDMPTPVLDGDKVVGGSLYADLNEWEVANSVGIAYTWLRNGVEVADGDDDDATFDLSVKDLGKKIVVEVSVSEPGFLAPTKQSAAALIKPGALVTKTPKITGKALVGAKLTVVPGKWGPSKVTLSYQWYANGKKIKKATKVKYKVVAKYKGKKITVKVTGTKAGYDNATKVSKAKKIKK